MIGDGKAKNMPELPEALIILNLAKTKIMLVDTHQKLTDAENLVEMVNNFKYLGVLLDHTLSWRDHVEYIGNKISSRLGMVSKVLPN